MKKYLKKKVLERINVNLEEHNIVQSFMNPHYQQHNIARLQHLESLKLDLNNKTVLEFGAGIGDHTVFYLHKNCSVLPTDGRQELVDFIKRRFNIETRLIDAETNIKEIKELQKVDIIHCYGLLYHISNPLEFIESLKNKCDLFLLETCVSSDTKEIGPHVVPEVKSHLSQATSGKGCRPSRKWIQKVLLDNFKYVYFPKTQPKHSEFKNDWSENLKDDGTNYIRSVFIASNTEIKNENLTTILPIKYEKWN